MLKSIQSNRSLAILLTSFITLAVFYSLVIPLFEGPDEDDHFRYARFLAERRALPVQEFVAGGGEAGHQGWQPPFFYSLAALVLSPLDTSDFPEHLWRNYQASFSGDPACCGRNIYFHLDTEDFPYTQTTLAVHLARLLSVLFGAMTVWATYQTARVLFRPPLFRLAAAALVAFNPTFLFASALVSNDALLAALAALVLWVWVRLLNDDLLPGRRTAVLLGVLLGLALLAKTTALGLVFFSVAAFAFSAWRRGETRLAFAGNALLLAIVILISGWWFVRNAVLYGDPLAYGLMTTSALFPRAGPLTLPELFQISLPWLWQTFWGGPTPGDFSPVLLTGLGILAVFAAIGVLAFALRPSNRHLLVTPIFLSGWLGFIFVAQVQFIRTTIGADQGRYLFPAISAFAVLFVLGLTETSKVARTASTLAPRLASALVIAGSFLLALYVPFAYTLPAYAHPTLATAADLARITHPVQVTFANRLQLLGYDLDARSIKPGETVRVTLYWRALAPIGESYRVLVHLIGQNDRTAGGVDVIPGRGAFPTVYWKPGDALRDVVSVPIAANAVPGKYAVEIGLYAAAAPGDRLMVNETEEDRVVVDALKVAPRQAVAYTPEVRAGADFAGQANLLGYDAHLDSNDLVLTLYWQSTRRMDHDYAVFVHVVDANGNTIAQLDQQPQAGNYPTSLWDPGEQVRDAYVLSLPKVAAGTRVRLGLYRQDTGERLPVRTAAGESDHVEFALPGAVR